MADELKISELDVIATINKDEAWIPVSKDLATTPVSGRVTPKTIAESIAISDLGSLANPTFTGTPAAPTAAVGTNTTQIATTAFVLANAPSDTVSVQNVTTANITGVANTFYFLNLSGLTANRNLVLPAPSAAGKSLKVQISTSDDTYKLGIIGTTGVTINGGTAATLWRYLQRKGEVVLFISTSTTNWAVVSSSINESATVISSGTPPTQALAALTWTKIADVFDTPTDQQGWWSVANKRYTLPEGKYIMTASLVACQRQLESLMATIRNAHWEWHTGMVCGTALPGLAQAMQCPVIFVRGVVAGFAGRLPGHGDWGSPFQIPQ